MAEAILKHRANNKYEVKSAGVFAYEGAPASANTIEVLKKNSISLDHYSSQLNDELVDWSDLILTMTNHHKQIVLEQYPRALFKIFSLKEYAQNSAVDIIDPFGGSIEDYAATYQDIENAIEELLKKIDKAEQSE